MRNIFYKFNFKTFVSVKPVNKPNHPAKKESIIKQTNNNNKPTNEITERKFCYINDDLKFNEYGFYLVAEHIYRRPKFTDLLNLTVICYIGSLNIYVCIAFLVLLNRDVVRNNILLTNVFRYITHIYLTRDMDKVVVKYFFPPVYRMYNIRDIKLLTQEEFINENHGQFAIVLINNVKTYIPIDILIHNKEVFSAIFQGYEIQKVPNFTQPNYIKLRSNDKINYF
jgi:hypothetical protein